MGIVPGRTLDQNLALLSQTTLVFPPGQGWHYSLGIDVLGAVVERASGQPLPQAVADRITTPLGLKDTGFAVSDLSRLAAAYADGKTPWRCATPCTGHHDS